MLAKTISILLALIIISSLTGCTGSDNSSKENAESTLSSESSETSKESSIKFADENTIIFGHYEQDANESNGKEPIEWNVLKIDGNQALIISKYVLDTHTYSTINTDSAWKSCQLREWLNGDFYNTAFDEAEKSRIILSDIENTDHTFYGFDEAGEATQDNIFCLSVNELTEFYSILDYDEDLQSGYSIDLLCEPTEYAKSKHVMCAEIEKGSYYYKYKYNNDDSCVGGPYAMWWLRDHGYHEKCSRAVNQYGNIGADYFYIDEDYERAGIRPALYIQI